MKMVCYNSLLRGSLALSSPQTSFVTVFFLFANLLIELEVVKKLLAKIWTGAQVAFVSNVKGAHDTNVEEAFLDS